MEVWARGEDKKVIVETDDGSSPPSWTFCSCAPFLSAEVLAAASVFVLFERAEFSTLWFGSSRLGCNERFGAFFRYFWYFRDL